MIILQFRQIAASDRLFHSIESVLMQNQIIGSRYRILGKIGSGSFGQVFECQNVRTGKRYAAKLESTSARVPQLAHEAAIYKAMSGSVHIADVRWYGQVKPNCIFVMDLLGRSLEDIHSSYHRLSLKTVLMLIDQMLTAIEFFHRKDYVHRDIKPDNFLIGRDNKCNVLHIIDFGLAKRYRDSRTREHIPFADGKSMTGTARYASVNSLRGFEQSRRDDLEALGFVWVYLATGSLPWMGIRTASTRRKYDLICDCKSRTTFESLTAGLPPEFGTYFTRVRRLKFAEDPPYADFRQMFRDLFIRLGFVYDYDFEWASDRRSRKKSAPPVPQVVTKPSLKAVRPPDPTSMLKFSGSDDSSRSSLPPEWDDPVSSDSEHLRRTDKRKHRALDLESDPRRHRTLSVKRDEIPVAPIKVSRRPRASSTRKRKDDL
jgi:serine/threonine protein kinase